MKIGRGHSLIPRLSLCTMSMLNRHTLVAQLYHHLVFNLSHQLTFRMSHLSLVQILVLMQCTFRFSIKTHLMILSIL